jgi:DNA-directed RNA polymerase specialized sigma24 family protein
MGEAADAGKVRARGSRVRAALPVIAVETREHWAVLLAKHNRLLRDYARHYLGDAAPEEDIEDTVERTLDVLLAVEEPVFDHALRYATQAVWRECQRTARRRELERTPVDRRLGPLTGRVARVLEQLGPRQRQTLMLAAQGLSPSDIARVDQSTAAAVRVRLYRARERVSELLQDGGVSAFLLFVPRRMKRAALRGGHVVARFADGVGSQAFASGALLPVVACAVLTSTGAPAAAVAAAPRVAPTVSTPAHADVASAFTSTPATGEPATPAVAIAPAHANGAAVTGGPLRNGLSVAPPAIPLVPLDVRITAIATPSRLDGPAVVVLAGYGTGCSCPRLEQSFDGGATWQSTAIAGPGFDQPPSSLALPPDYPRDPRIFTGTSTAIGGPPYMATAFGRPFQALDTLPAGPIAVSAHFDDGDPRVFVAGLTALWSARIDSGAVAQPHEEIDYSTGGSLTNTSGQVATPTSTPGGPAVVAWVPPAAVVPDAPAVSPSMSSLVECPVGTPCTFGATTAISPWRLVSRGATVVAFSASTAYVSHDFGATATQLVSPSGSPLINSVALAGSPSALQLWMIVYSTKTGEDIVRLLPTGTWASVAPHDSALRTSMEILVPVGDHRVIATLVNEGYSCTNLDSGHWLPRCPA